MIRSIAIDDEPLALDILSIHAAKVPDLALVGQFTDPFRALEYLKDNPVDLVFLDINMPGLSGMDLIRQLQCPPRIVFTTAYSEYALDSYDFEAVDYLLKPIDFDRFNRAVQRFRKQAGQGNGTSAPVRPDFVFLKDGTKQVRVSIPEITHIRSDRNYLEVHTAAGRIVTRMTLPGLLELIGTGDFIRIHNSWAVNLTKIDRIENNHVYIGPVKIPVGEKYREEFRRIASRGI